jgi:putative nucleotidyltransferase with HDIG domain
VALPLPSDIPLFPRPAKLSQLLLVYPDASLEDYVRVVNSDPALMAQVISLANSAANRGLSEVRSAHEAIVRLGTDTTRRAISLMVMRGAFGSLEDSGLAVDDLWWHLLGTGLLAESMCTEPAQAPVAFAAGLLHDIGRLSLAAMNPTRYRAVVIRVQNGEDVERAERKEMGAAHIHWGEQVAQHWRLSPEIIEAIAHHHDGTNGVSGLVTRARELLTGLGFGDGLTRGGPGIGALVDADANPAIQIFGGREGLMARLAHFGEPDD